MNITDLYNELKRIKTQSLFSQKEKERITINWVEKYAKENGLSFDAALDNINDYVTELNKEEEGSK